jgi:hypothetical protein
MSNKKFRIYAQKQNKFQLTKYNVTVHLDYCIVNEFPTNDITEIPAAIANFKKKYPNNVVLDLVS